MAKVECIIKRKSGTEVVMGGKHPLKQRVYHFKPINPSDPRSPHVCDVDNEEDFDAFMRIREGYRRYKEDQPPVMAIKPPTALEPSIKRVNYDDILSINNIEELDNEWLAGFSLNVLGIKSTDRNALVEHAKLYEITDIKKSNPALQIIRMILGKMIEQERLGAAAAAGVGGHSDDDVTYENIGEIGEDSKSPDGSGE